jgi:hypothetical protein
MRMVIRSKTGGTGMKSFPISLAAVAALVAMTGLFGTPPLMAGELIEVGSPAAYDSPNPVLEIPQDCTSETAPPGCGQDDAAANSGDPSAVANDPNAVAATTDPNQSIDPTAEQASNRNIGTLEDYESQARGSAPAVVAVPYPVPYPVPYAAPSRYPVYVGRPVLAPAPMPMASYPSAPAPFVPRMMPAPGMITRTRPAWALAPAPAMPMMRPMSPAGMGGALRLH